MSGTTEIAWTDRVWNPVVGCTRVSAGCDHCYAFALHDKRHVAWKRGRWDAAPAQYHEPFSRVQLLPDRLTDPLRWRKPARIFVNSMSDLFHPDVPDEFIDRVFAVMALSPQHTFQVLTKRPERMREYLSDTLRAYEPGAWHVTAGLIRQAAQSLTGTWQVFPEPLPNVWLGTSAEDQKRADERIPELLACPAAVRFVSLEPLLGAVDLTRVNLGNGDTGDCLNHRATDIWTGAGDTSRNWGKIHWVIVGGESGPGARPCDIAWIRSVVQQCQAAGVAVFVKQDSGSKPGLQGRIPDELWIKEFPGGGR